MKKLKLTEAQRLLAIHLKELGLQPEFEFKFCTGRRWRFDVVVLGGDSQGKVQQGGWGFEVNGHWHGKHGAGWSGDAEKLNMAQALGYKVFVFHNRTVLNGKAKAWVAKHLLLRGEE